MVAEQIATKLAVLEPHILDIVNESHMHSGPATESHFKLIIVSDEFAGKRSVARHQSIYRLLAEELEGPVHALSLHTYTPDEFDPQQVPLSPNCLGGSKAG
ncbi:transcriptional regulator [Bacterioplanes sanyensis]|uniref:Transcriptional regulator n=1 Tax=Bacterioplanes sanyensis TaxID=1249553 RepID=A0A222FK10_9GAMM|nr:BolA/IbaG family iron-sulfur metabolism protein [Bacterioplanes sanyensis]ASP39385.1 transcriptional regulator [Bacterioplanes sanyensis]